MYLFLCLQFDTMSNRLLIRRSFSLKLHITNFSSRHRLHDFEAGLYPDDFLDIDLYLYICIYKLS